METIKQPIQVSVDVDFTCIDNQQSCANQNGCFDCTCQGCVHD